MPPIPVTDADGQDDARWASSSRRRSGSISSDGGLVDAQGKVQDCLKQALKDGTFTLPEAFAASSRRSKDDTPQAGRRLEIKNADERKPVKTRQAVLHSEEFKALWDRIKHKTTYRVQFDNEKLDRELHQGHRRRTRRSPRPGCNGARPTSPSAGPASRRPRRRRRAPVVLDEGDIELPDLLTDLQDKTQLTRRSLVRILTGSGRLDDFKRNPQEFIEMAAEAINRTKRLAIVDGIKYQRLGDEHYYAQELFEQEELTGYLKNMLAMTTKSVYEHVVYDSAPRSRPSRSSWRRTRR